MKKLIIILTIFSIVLISGYVALRFLKSKPNTEQSFPGCTCHSKNPNLVKMHKNFTPLECTQCHSNPMSGKKVDKSELKAKKYKDKKCTVCHKKPKQTKVAQRKGMMYCYQSGKYYPKGTFSCPVHNDPLIDLAKVIKLAKEKPSKDICLACHPATDDLVKKHNERNEKITKSTDCIKCHKKHLKCEGCHY